MSVRGETLAGARLAAGLIRVARRHGDAQDHADAVAALLEAVPIRALLEAVPIRALLSASAGHETSPVWRFTAASADGSGSLDDVLGQVQATTAGALAWLVVDGEGDRLGLCGLPGCRAAFVDERDRGRRRRFCSDRCRAAAAVRTHRDRAWLREHGGGSPATEGCAGMGPR
ncbi:CGNR zinc finger domain-containing protein [Micrococcus endophyticus]|uniref:CGNR zinc finger domain-containing protein n=1 Tax=Micrococcus endophyticus TaxID=455343 RepID=UPI0035A8E8F6